MTVIPYSPDVRIALLVELRSLRPIDTSQKGRDPGFKCLLDPYCECWHGGLQLVDANNHTGIANSKVAIQEVLFQVRYQRQQKH